MTGRRVAAATLGCKVNMYDTEAMLGLFEEKGYKIVDFEEAADVYIINTCTVTNLGDRKSRQMIRRARKKNPQAIIVAAGCYAQVAPDQVKSIEGINLVTGVKDRKKIVQLVEEYSPQQDVVENVSDIMSEREFEEIFVNKTVKKTAADPQGRTRAFLKIQEGCDRFCAYCIIPYARGPVRSRKPEDVIGEVEFLAAGGFKEIVLSGIHVASYGKDLGGTDLVELIKSAHHVEGILRIRLSSIDPLAITEDFVTELSSLPKICEHFHLSLQSGCDRTLKRMNRKYSAMEYEAAAKRLREGFRDVALTTDVIVGFPGETDRDFEDSLEFVERIGFSRLHVFPYSPKSGTPAAGFENQVTSNEKDRRSKRMIALGEKMAADFFRQQAGKKVEVLIERKIGKNIYEGHTRNYMTLQVESDEDITNKIVLTVADGNVK